MLDVSVGGADGLWREAIEVGGEIAEESDGIRLLGGRLGRRQCKRNQQSNSCQEITASFLAMDWHGGMITQCSNRLYFMR